MKHLPVLILLVALVACTSHQVSKPVAIHFQTIDLSEAKASAVRDNQLILAYFFTDG
jgi:hypothetical protein